ncbi:MAG: site-specific integrase [Bacteroidetes bacterium]|nr:site-specific integrase [Bacteroidota bacterium]
MIENNKEKLKMLSKDQSLIPSTQNQHEVNPAERFFEMFLSIMPKMAEAFQNSSTAQIVTLRVFTDEYMYLIKNNCSASYAESVQLSFNHLTGFFDIQRTLCSIQQKDVENFLVYLQQKVKKGYVVYFRNLKAAFNKAREWKYVSENFFTKVKLPKKQKAMPVFINSDQLSTIGDQIKNEVVRNVVVFAFYTGMRLDEIVNLRWKNVDVEKRIITVGDENFITKGRNQRFIPICEEAEKAIENLELRIQNENKNIISIRSQKYNRDFVFCKSNGERFTGDYISKRFKLACKAAGFDNTIHFHSLRHSFASNLAQKGVSLYTIKELLGHSSISTTEIYSHLNVESLREAIKKLDETPSCVLPLSKGEKSVVKIFKINSAEEE